jgi:prepilin-type N-terminal cleavage/methylation domain-containing protein
VDTKRGFTLVEVLIAVGVIALVAAGAVTVSASARSMAVSSAANRFDSLLDAARTIARESSNGVTIAFTPDAHGDGVIARLYQNRPGTEPLVASNAPALEARVSITETEALGAPPFALVIHATGAVAGITGNVLVGTAGPETPCPGSGRYRFVLAYGGAHAERVVSCHVDLAANGPVSYASIAPATPQPLPTVMDCVTARCSGVPAIPRVTVTCPPKFTPTNAASCINRVLVVFPDVLTFSSPGHPVSLTYTVQEDSYIGSFRIADNCSGAIADVINSGNGQGSMSTYGVTALRSGSCSITVNDEYGNAGVVQIRIGNPTLVQQIVCDTRIPPAAYGTDLGPDPDGIHEDISNGMSCNATPAPPPLNTASPAPPAVAQVTVVEIQIIADCDAGAEGSFFDVMLPSTDVTMGDVTRWLAGAAKRFAQPNPASYDPATPVSATLDERHMAPLASQCHG